MRFPQRRTNRLLFPFLAGLVIVLVACQGKPEMTPTQEDINALLGRVENLELRVKETQELQTREFETYAEQLLDGQSDVYAEAILALREEVSKMRLAYQTALAAGPPIPPVIIHQQAAMPRPDIDWSLAVEPRLTQARQGYGRVSITSLVAEDATKVVGLSRLPIEKRGVIHGYVQATFPSEKYWASLAVKIKFFEENQPASLAGNIFFVPELPLEAIYPCKDVSIFISLDGTEWLPAANGCNPQIKISQDSIVAVAVDVQRSN